MAGIGLVNTYVDKECTYTIEISENYVKRAVSYYALSKNSRGKLKCNLHNSLILNTNDSLIGQTSHRIIIKDIKNPQSKELFDF